MRADIPEVPGIIQENRTNIFASISGPEVSVETLVLHILPDQNLSSELEIRQRGKMFFSPPYCLA